MSDRDRERVGDDISGTERACANVIIGQVLRSWDAHQGDGVTLLRRMNSLVAMSIAVQRRGATPSVSDAST